MTEENKKDSVEKEYDELVSAIMRKYYINNLPKELPVEEIKDAKD